jgi:hypothetical protein
VIDWAAVGDLAAVGVERPQGAARLHSPPAPLVGGDVQFALLVDRPVAAEHEGGVVQRLAGELELAAADDVDVVADGQVTKQLDVLLAEIGQHPRRLPGTVRLDR